MHKTADWQPTVKFHILCNLQIIPNPVHLIDYRCILSHPGGDSFLHGKIARRI